MTWVVVARERAAGVVSVGAFLVDAWCLGVKDAYANELTRGEVEALLDEQLPPAQRVPIAPAEAKRLVEGAVAYAQGLGFLPHREFRKARKVLSGIDAAAATREFQFGHEGKPRFVIGPDDDDARVNRVLAVLTARFGADGFVAEEIDEEDDDDFDWDAMDALFRYVESPQCPDRSLTGYVVSGFIAAAVLVDPAREIDAWWRELFGGVEPVLPDDETNAATEIVDGFVEVFGDIEAGLEAGDFVPGLPPLTEPDHDEVAAEFCRGFLRVVDARPEVAMSWERNPDAAGALATLRRLAENCAAPDAAGRRAAAPIIAAAIATIDAVTRLPRSDGSAPAPA